MGEIEINLQDQWNFEFSTFDGEVLCTERGNCYYCNCYLHSAYTYIIERLKEADLLDKDYKLICCYCKILENFGLLDLRDNVSGFRYDSDTDILSITFSFLEITKIEPKARFSNSIGKWHYFYFYIHDYSKVKWD